MLNADNAVAVVIDVQAKLLPAIHEAEAVVEAAGKVVRGAEALEIPVLWTEQNPDGLGATVEELAELLSGEPITKGSFSCCGEERFTEELAALGRKQVLLTGIETHVCVYQTALDLMAAGYEVHVVADAVGSRTPRNRRIAIHKMADAGAQITTAEMALFEMLGSAEHPAFKQVLKIVK